MLSACTMTTQRHALLVDKPSEEDGHGEKQGLSVPCRTDDARLIYVVDWTPPEVVECIGEPCMYCAELASFNF